MNHGIYIHVPFCRKKCGYCSFYSIPELNLIEKYTDRMIKDIKETLYGSEKISADTVYFGGGTPSLLNPESVAGILNNLNDAADISENAEITLEMNPEDATDSKISELTDAGINRIVLGAQTLNRKCHDLIGRSGEICDWHVLDTFFSREGFIHCIDIIAGIPGQAPGSIKSEIAELIEYHPEHISAYILSVEKGTAVYDKILRNEAYEKMQIDVFRNVIDYIKDAGYDHYEISNFALPGNRSRHNMKYWKYEPYIGFGPSSHSFFRNERYSIDMNVSDYINSVEVRKHKDERNFFSAIAEIILTGLRLSDGISIDEISEKSEIQLPVKLLSRLESLSIEGKINISPEGVVAISKEYFFLADSIIYEAVQDII